MVSRIRFHPTLSKNTVLDLWVLIRLFSIMQLFPIFVICSWSFIQYSSSILPCGGPSDNFLFELRTVPSSLLFSVVFLYLCSSMNNTKCRIFVHILKSFSWSSLSYMGPTPLCFWSCYWYCIATKLRHAGIKRGYIGPVYSFFCMPLSNAPLN